MLRNSKFIRARHVGAVLGAGLLGGAIGVAVLGTSQAQEPAVPTPTPIHAAAPAPPAAAGPAVWSPTVQRYRAAGTPTDDPTAVRAAADGADADGTLRPEDARDVAAPEGAGVWTVIPGDAVTCLQVTAGRLVCGHDDRLAQAGVAAVWNRPAASAPGTAAVTFDGLAVDAVTRIDAIAADGTTVASTSPQASVFSLRVAAADAVVALRVTGDGGRTATVPVG